MVLKRTAIDNPMQSLLLSVNNCALFPLVRSIARCPFSFFLTTVLEKMSTNLAYVNFMFTFFNQFCFFSTSLSRILKSQNCLQKSTLTPTQK